MKKSLYLIVSHEIDFEFCTHSVMGACNSLDLAVSKMREFIVENFDELGYKELLEEYEECSVKEQFQEWINENYLDDEHTLWSYTSDDVEYVYKVVTIELDGEESPQEAYALVHTCVDGIVNNTVVVGVYTTQEEADSAMESYQAENDSDDEEIENFISVENIVVLQ